MAATPTRDATLVGLLNEAYTKERQLDAALDAHARMMSTRRLCTASEGPPEGDESHATQVSKRIKQLGGTPETVSIPVPEG